MSNCNRHPIAICLHCREHLCVDHLLQHNEELIQQANLYCDEFNQITEQVENISFDKQFAKAEEDLNDWANDQMKQLDKILEQKLFELNQARSKVAEKLKTFKEKQHAKIADIQRRLFNEQLSKQICPQQLSQMKRAVEQLRREIEHFKMKQCVITLINNDETNYSYKPNIDVQIRNIGDEYEKSVRIHNIIEKECQKMEKSQLRADAKPFVYEPKEQNCCLLSPFHEKGFSSQLLN